MIVRALGGATNEPKRGQVVVLFAILATVLLGFMGMALDIGLVLAQKRSTQKIAAVCAIQAGQIGINGADSTVTSNVRARANSCLSDNGITTGITVNSPPTSGAFRCAVSTSCNNFVEVSVNNRKSTLFAQVVGVSTLPVYGRAVAGGNAASIFALMGLRPNTDSITCSGCPNTTIQGTSGNACTAGQMNANGNGMQVFGEVAANQGFDGQPPQSPPATNLQPGAPCADPVYGLPSPRPGYRAPLTTGFAIYDQESGPDNAPHFTCPSPGNTKRATGTEAVVIVSCANNDNAVEIYNSRLLVDTSSNRGNVVRLCGNNPPTCSSGTAVFQTVIGSNANGPVLELYPGYYDTIAGNGGVTRFKDGLYIISTGFDQGNAAASAEPRTRPAMAQWRPLRRSR